MKFIRSFFLIFILILSSSFYKLENNKLETGFYFLSETEADGVLIEDIDNEIVYAIERMPIIDIKDFTKVKFSKKNFKPTPQKVIEITLTKEGKKKWKAAKKRISKTGESIMFICNDKVYLEQKILSSSPKEEINIELFFEKKDMDYVFEVINQKMYLEK